MAARRVAQLTWLVTQKLKKMKKLFKKVVATPLFFSLFTLQSFSQQYQADKDAYQKVNESLLSHFLSENKDDVKIGQFYFRKFDCSTGLKQLQDKNVYSYSVIIGSSENSFYSGKVDLLFGNNKCCLTFDYEGKLKEALVVDKIWWSSEKSEPLPEIFKEEAEKLISVLNSKSKY